jgi:hypothetical protein
VLVVAASATAVFLCGHHTSAPVGRHREDALPSQDKPQQEDDGELYQAQCHYQQLVALNR